MKTRRFTNDAGKVLRTSVMPWTACGKFGYTSRKLAKAVAAEQTRLTGTYIEAYHCKRGCHSYHIGHPWKTRQAS